MPPLPVTGLIDGVALGENDDLKLDGEAGCMSKIEFRLLTDNGIPDDDDEDNKDDEDGGCGGASISISRWLLLLMAGLSCWFCSECRVGSPLPPVVVVVDSMTRLLADVVAVDGLVGSSASGDTAGGSLLTTVVVVVALESFIDNDLLMIGIFYLKQNVIF